MKHLVKPVTVVEWASLSTGREYVDTVWACGLGARQRVV
jgi:hypothetical protein